MDLGQIHLLASLQAPDLLKLALLIVQLRDQAL
jgi:hypothetical protein